MSEGWFDELAELVRIPSVSADPAHAGDVEQAAEWLAEFVRRGGGEAEVVKTDTHPLILGELTASNGAAAPTVLVYGHVDVQPPDPLELWESEPFAPEVRGEWLYGRGVADDKGQLYMLVKAATELAAAGELAVNVRIACDSEEETGGHQIVDFLAADERGADAAVIFDSGMTRRGVPEFNIGTRGLVYLHLTVRTGERDLHSGVYGTAALNAMHALTQILDAVRPRDGRLPEPLRAGIVPPTDEEISGWAQLVPGSVRLDEAGARPADPRAPEEFYLRTTAEPSLDVNGIVGGSPLLQKTVLPVTAEANLSIRLAPGQDVDEIAVALERLLRESAPEGAELEVTRLSTSPPGLVRPDEPAVQLALGAFERAFGHRPLFVRSGGTLPIIPALAAKGIPTILTGFALPESNIHSPNERILAEYLPLGIEVSRELFKSLAALDG
ncbi:MAG TPA: M20/M25/M40 family metallo-hydrolase [Gaiellaceae bacterium]|jgi:acetylornithine deacetylase/succinyl-diaminopimelate desuccinylase-like protein